MDQTLFVLAKEIQWRLGGVYDEDWFVFMLGGPHEEIVSWKMLGRWLTGTGWVEPVCSAGVVTQGVAESLLTASHLSRTRPAHQVPIISLYIISSILFPSIHTNINTDTKYYVSILNIVFFGPKYLL